MTFTKIHDLYVFITLDSHNIVTTWIQKYNLKLNYHNFKFQKNLASNLQYLFHSAKTRV